ncbi:MAG: hypothetical protein F4W89_06930 [Acidobacteria bacterium]|nr:hypothetical protein [Acidobacteriota bacterium]
MPVALRLPRLNRHRLRRFAWGAIVAAAALSALLFVLSGAADRTGVRRQVFSGVGFNGTPLLDDVSTRITLDFLNDDPGLPRRFFSVRWTGYWYVPEAGDVELLGAGDDRLDVWLDGELIIRRTPPADMHTAVRTVWLEPGVHELRVEYEQHGGAFDMRLEWAPPGGVGRPLRADRLFREWPDSNDIRLAYGVTWLQRVVVTLWIVVLGITLVWLGTLVGQRVGPRSPYGRYWESAFRVAGHLLPQRERSIRWTIRLSLLLASTAVALVTSEIYLRLTAPVGFYVWPPNHRAAFDPAPGAMPGVTGVSRFIISADGVRGRRLKISDGYRILVVGGSTSECLYLDQGEAWPAIVETSLQKALGRSDIWVGNVGRSGRSTRDHRLQVARLLDQLPRIDVVILLVGINDLLLRLRLDLDYRPLAEESIEYHRSLERRAFAVRRTFRLAPLAGDPALPRFARTALGSLLYEASIVAGLTEPGWADDIQDSAGSFYVRNRQRRQRASAIRSVPPDLGTALIEYAENLRFIIAAAERRDTDVVLVTQPSLYGPALSPTLRELLWLGRVERSSADNEYYSVGALATALGRYNETLLTVCATARIGCIDLAAKLPKDTTVFYDDVHFNEAGSRQVATKVVAHLLDRTTSLPQRTVPRTAR